MIYSNEIIIKKLIMKRLFYFALMLALCSSCHRSLEDRASQECKEYTEKKCPTPVVDNVRLDSMVFESTTRTIHYYNTLVGTADNRLVIDKQQGKLRQALKEGLRSDAGTKAYKDAGFNFQYTYHSEKKPSEVLFDATYTTKDYQ